MVTINSFAQSGSLPPAIKEEIVTYKAGDITLNGFVAWDENIKGKRPVVLVVHEWWGLNDYAKMRARKLAELGYFAMAVDMYGNGKTAADPKQAQEFASPFYQDPGLAKMRLDAAIKKVKEYPQADPGMIAAIGYCFGGSVVLNSAKLGADLVGVVSFHGGLAGTPADKKLLKAEILVCHGGNDKFVSQEDVDTFKQQLDSIGAEYTFNTYPNATHAFTNPDATKTGKEFNMPIEYNAEADRDSWNDMKDFLRRIFGR
ncbi:MAG: dienelactone hydrolase family protein [Bacteroidales bacterium]|nr:dienelactone hydrolase family protein [Bacteroidales bacterium]